MLVRMMVPLALVFGVLLGSLLGFAFGIRRTAHAPQTIVELQHAIAELKEERVQLYLRTRVLEYRFREAVGQLYGQRLSGMQRDEEFSAVPSRS